jgi:hypothetical protein
MNNETEKQSEARRQLEMFIEDVEYSAEWRRRKTEEYADDERNVWSAEALEYLHKWLQDGNDPIISKFAEALERVFSNDDAGYKWIEEQNSKYGLGRFGFDGGFSGDDTCREFLIELIRKADECAKVAPIEQGRKTKKETSDE